MPILLMWPLTTSQLPRSTEFALIVGLSLAAGGAGPAQVADAVMVAARMDPAAYGNDTLSSAYNWLHDYYRPTVETTPRLVVPIDTALPRLVDEGAVPTVAPA